MTDLLVLFKISSYMRNSQAFFIIAFFIIFILIDLYTYFGLKNTFSSQAKSNSFRYIYFGLSFFLMAGLLIGFSFMGQSRSPALWYWIMLVFVGGFFLIFIPKLNFSVFQLFGHIFSLFNKNAYSLFTKAGFVFFLLIMVMVAYGIILGRFHFKENHIKVENIGLKNERSSLRIVHISDIHLGSFYGQQKRIAKQIDKINTLNPDLIFITGDFVNHFSGELKGWDNVFMNLNAKHGVYSILGNHDYGDYLNWENKEEKKQNLDELIRFQRRCGIDVLLNESRKINVEGTSISIIGVENWGALPFHQYGDLKKALEGTDSSDIRLLLSHDPSHWRAEVVEKTDIDFTFSGHTHGMQVGVDLGSLKFSPVKWIYKEWYGLYKENNQYLYVTKGFGHIGMPARIGMRPEIAVINIKN